MGSAIVDESASKNSKTMITDFVMRRQHINRAAMGGRESSVDVDEFNTLKSNSKY